MVIWNQNGIGSLPDYFPPRRKVVWPRYDCSRVLNFLALSKPCVQTERYLLSGIFSYFPSPIPRPHPSMHTASSIMCTILKAICAGAGFRSGIKTRQPIVDIPDFQVYRPL